MVPAWVAFGSKPVDGLSVWPESANPEVYRAIHPSRYIVRRLPGILGICPTEEFISSRAQDSGQMATDEV